jgi:signal transduction histidine kinase
MPGRGMQSTVRIVLVEDSPLDAELELAHLTAACITHECRRVNDREDFIDELKNRTPDLILCEYSLPGFDGLSALQIAQEICPEVPFLFVSGVMGEEVAIETLKRGASDYVVKERIWWLAPAVSRALREARQRRERLMAEEELTRKVRELSVLNADLEQFVYAANHDLQEPLRIITVFSKLLFKKCNGVVDAEGHEYIEHIEQAAKRMSALLEDLLVYAKVPLQDDRSKPADLNAVVRETLALFTHLLKEAGAEIAVGELPIVQGNSDQLGLVFQNLIANALKYRSDKPPHVQISASQAGGNWVVAVQDNGIGFEQRYADQVFGLFKRLNKEPDGTGLGLTICKRIVELHGGRIWAQSEPDAGATFFFSLPAAQKPAAFQAGHGQAAL